MNSENRAQTVKLLMFQESLCESLRQFMSAPIASEPSQTSTEIILSQIETMSHVLLMMRELATALEDGGDDTLPF